MITEEKKEDLIERYLMGDFRSGSWQRSRNLSRLDASFAEDVGFERDLLIGIRESKRLQLKEELKQAEANPKIFWLPPIDRSKILRYAIAACITVGVIGSIFYPTVSDALTPNSKIARHLLQNESKTSNFTIRDERELKQYFYNDRRLFPSWHFSYAHWNLLSNRQGKRL